MTATNNHSIINMASPKALNLKPMNNLSLTINLGLKIKITVGDPFSKI